MSDSNEVKDLPPWFVREVQETLEKLRINGTVPRILAKDSDGRKLAKPS